jgi:hypothetical protein
VEVDGWVMESKSLDGPVFRTNYLHGAGAALWEWRLMDGMKSKSFGWVFIYWTEDLQLCVSIL